MSGLILAVLEMLGMPKLEVTKEAIREFCEWALDLGKKLTGVIPGVFDDKVLHVLDQMVVNDDVFDAIYGVIEHLAQSPEGAVDVMALRDMPEPMLLPTGLDWEKIKLVVQLIVEILKMLKER